MFNKVCCTTNLKFWYFSWILRKITDFSAVFWQKQPLNIIFFNFWPSSVYFKCFSRQLLFNKVSCTTNLKFWYFSWILRKFFGLPRRFFRSSDHNQFVPTLISCTFMYSKTIPMKKSVGLTHFFTPPHKRLKNTLCSSRSEHKLVPIELASANLAGISIWPI